MRAVLRLAGLRPLDDGHGARRPGRVGAAGVQDRRARASSRRPTASCPRSRSPARAGTGSRSRARSAPATPSDETKRMFEAYEEYYEAARAALRAGATAARRAPRRREGLPRPRLRPRPRHRPLDRDDDDRVPEDRRGGRDGAAGAGWCSRCTRTRSRRTGGRASTCRTRGSSPTTAACRSPACRCGSTTAGNALGSRTWRRIPTSSPRSCPAPGESDYERYLRTDELLSLQKAPDEWVHRDELLFQTVHQSSELWLKHAWTGGRGGDAADRGARPRRRAAAAPARVRRACGTSTASSSTWS